MPHIPPQLFFDEQDEEWRPTAVPAYDISHYGRLRRNGRILKPALTSVGYIVYGLWFEGRRISGPAHRLVCRAFHGEPDGWERLEVNHKDGNKLNPRADNLEWVTRSENARHMHRLGLHGGSRGERCGRARLTNERVLAIRAAHVDGRRILDVAQQFKEPYTTVRKIIKRERWSHI